jgi:hypothetical protein
MPWIIHLLALITAEFTGFGWQKMILLALPFRAEALKNFGFNRLSDLDFSHCFALSIMQKI